MRLAAIKKALAGLTILLGLWHVVCILPLAELDPDTLWYIGSGIAIVFAGLINLVAANSKGKLPRTVAMLANIITAGLFVLAYSVIREVPMVVGVLLFAVQAFLTLTWKRTP